MNASLQHGRPVKTMNWFDLPFFSAAQWSELQGSLETRRSQVNVFPPEKQVFRAFELTPLESVKVVILGQDPYHRPGQAHGLCFSVPEGVTPPPSLRNILKEVNRDLEATPTRSTDLTDWATQGVLLLNTSLTVEEGKPGSHARKGWQELLHQTIDLVNRERPHVVFLLWGNPARAYAKRIDPRHTILEAVHPSPLSAHRGFHGCSHFSLTNRALIEHGQQPVKWG